MSRRELIAKAKQISWFHAIDFGDYVSPGRFAAEKTPNATLLPVFHFLKDTAVESATCLDIGAADGLMAFVMKELGAGHVVATDGRPQPGFEIARELLNMEVEYLPDVLDTDLGKRFPPQSFDIIVMAGFLYHLFGPLSILATCRKLIRPGGLLITETVYTGGSEPKLLLNTELEPPLTEQISTYFIPTKQAVEGMLKLVCFQPLASGTVGRLLTDGGVGRLAHISRAGKPSEISGRRPQLVSTHEMLRSTPDISFEACDKEEPVSAARFSGESEHIEVPHDLETPWISVQPTREDMRRLQR